MKKIAIDLPLDRIKEFCEKWQIQELALFGSVLRDDFDPMNSDVDVLVLFSEDAKISLFSLVTMEEELKEIFKRNVDLLSKRGVEEDSNPFRKEAILKDYEVIYDKAA